MGDILTFLLIVLFATPIFYMKFWFIAFLPIAFGIGMSLWRHRISYVVRWTLISIPVAYVATAITIIACFSCLIKISFP